MGARIWGTNKWLTMANRTIQQTQDEERKTDMEKVIQAIEEYGAACQAFGAHVERVSPPDQDITGVHRSILDATHRPMMDAYSRLMNELKRFATGRQEK